jgi:DNA-binding FadR family transcriptional regulator
VVELAVTHATEADFERMDECIERAERAGSISEFEQWDDALHRALAASAHNALVGRLYEMVSQARSNTGWGRLKQRSLTPERRLAYQQEHRRVVAALRQRDAARARARMLEHLRHVRRSLLDE